MRNCETCSKDISDKPKNQRFCSKACASAVKKRDRICVQCGKHFHPRPDSNRGQKAQKYCSTECRGNARKKVRICQWCQKEFTRTHNGQPKYCSEECFILGRRKGRQINTYVCYKCGTSFGRYESTVRNPDRVYCSSECYMPGRVYPTGKNHPQYKNGSYINSAGYIYERDYNNRKLDGDYAYKAQHVKVAEEQIIHRPLAEHEHVHHLSVDKTNNRPENLLVLTEAQHKAVHDFYQRQFRIEHEALGDLRDITIKFIESLE